MDGPISEEYIEIPNGVYNALWSAFNLEITVNGNNLYIRTIKGCKGINQPIIVEVIDGIAYEDKTTNGN